MLGGQEGVSGETCPHSRCWKRSHLPPQPAAQGAGSYLLMVLLEANQLFFQGLCLHFQVRPGQGQAVQQGPQGVDVGLHVLPQSVLSLIPTRGDADRSALILGSWFFSF